MSQALQNTMIERRKGDILKAGTQALVNTVNCVGVMGKGIALQFKLKFPENFREYEKVCKHDDLEPGRVFVFDRGKLFEDDQSRYIVNFPTKKHWRSKSKLEYIDSGMDALVQEVLKRGIKSIAIPPLGCGNGGLKWSDVESIIKAHATEMPGVHVVLYPPGYEPSVDQIDVNTKRPRMTRGRALVLKVLDLYKEPGYRHGKLEAQKLAYLLQSAGEDMKLDFVADKYGPYANNLNHVFQHMEGHFVEGYGDREQNSEIRLLPGAIEESETEIEESTGAHERLRRVRDLIEGFETPFGLELMATVLWVIQNNPRAVESVHQTIMHVHSWNRRKEELFTPQQIEIAWNRLSEQGWTRRREMVPA